jgi:hypothetical protein
MNILEELNAVLKICKLIFSKALKKGEKAYSIFVLTTMTITIMASPVYAAQPKLVTGTVALFQAATTWLLVIIPVGAGTVLGYTALQKSLTDDHAVLAEKNKMMKNVLIGAAIAETSSGLVTAILAFYA